MDQTPRRRANKPLNDGVLMEHQLLALWHWNHRRVDPPTLRHTGQDLGLPFSTVRYWLREEMSYPAIRRSKSRRFRPSGYLYHMRKRHGVHVSTTERHDQAIVKGILAPLWAEIRLKYGELF